MMGAAWQDETPCMEVIISDLIKLIKRMFPIMAYGKKNGDYKGSPRDRHGDETSVTNTHTHTLNSLAY